MKATELLSMLVVRRQRLRDQWTAIDRDPMASRFDQVRTARRTEASIAWLEEIRGALRTAVETDLPEMRRQRAENQQTAQLGYERELLGRRARSNPLDPGEDSYQDELKRWSGAWEGLVVRLDKVAGELAKANAWSRWNIASTDDIRGRIEEAARAHEKGSFDWDSWYSDRQALRSVLQARVVGNDPGANFGVQRLEALERVLVTSHVPGDPQQIDFVEREVSSLRAMAEHIHAKSEPGRRCA